LELIIGCCFFYFPTPICICLPDPSRRFIKNLAQTFEAFLDDAGWKLEDKTATNRY
jgi:hypothetical protein